MILSLEKDLSADTDVKGTVSAILTSLDKFGCRLCADHITFVAFNFGKSRKKYSYLENIGGAVAPSCPPLAGATDCMALWSCISVHQYNYI